MVCLKHTGKQEVTVKWLPSTLITHFLCCHQPGSTPTLSFRLHIDLNNRKGWFKWLKNTADVLGDCLCMRNPKFRSFLCFLGGKPFWLEAAVLFACYQRHTAALFPPTGALTQVPQRLLIFHKALPVENVGRLLRLFRTQKIRLQWLGCISAPDKLKWLEHSLSSFRPSNTQTDKHRHTLMHTSSCSCQVCIFHPIEQAATFLYLRISNSFTFALRPHVIRLLSGTPLNDGSAHNALHTGVGRRNWNNKHVNNTKII